MEQYTEHKSSNSLITGLPFKFFVSPDPKNGHHEVRFKLNIDNEMNSFSLDGLKHLAGRKDIPSKDKKLVAAFIKKNRENILKYWRSEISTEEYMNNLKKVFPDDIKKP